MELMDAVANVVSAPVIASGGMGTVNDLVSVARSTDVTGIAMADVLHFGRFSVQDIRTEARLAGLDVRDYE